MHSYQMSQDSNHVRRCLSWHSVRLLAFVTRQLFFCNQQIVMSLHWTLYTAYCTLHTAHCTLHTAHCTLHIAHHLLSILPFKSFTGHCRDFVVTRWEWRPSSWRPSYSWPPTLWQLHVHWPETRFQKKKYSSSYLLSSVSVKATRRSDFFQVPPIVYIYNLPVL